MQDNVMNYGGPQPQTPPPKRPMLWAAVCVLGMFFGGLNVCCSIWGIGGMVMEPYVTDLQKSQPGMTAEQQKSMQDAQKRMMDIQHAHRPGQIAELVLAIVLGIVLVAACALAWRGRQSAVNALVGISMIGMVFEVVRTVFEVYVQLAMSRELQQVVLATSQAFPDADTGGAFQKILGWGVGASVGLGVCIAIAWALLKLAYYATTVVATKRPDIRNYLSFVNQARS